VRRGVAASDDCKWDAAQLRAPRLRLAIVDRAPERWRPPTAQRRAKYRSGLFRPPTDADGLHRMRGLRDPRLLRPGARSESKPVKIGRNVASTARPENVAKMLASVKAKDGEALLKLYTEALADFEHKRVTILNPALLARPRAMPLEAPPSGPPELDDGGGEPEELDLMQI
jgi:hypothetical protein